jgi:Pro-kumamolisin, activation domain/FG-GAP-like repeat/Bacterial Ig-like domain (group 3)/FG-GAP repeat
LCSGLAILAVLLAGTCNAQQPSQALHNHVHREVATGQAPLVGSLPPEQRMNLSIVLPLRNQAELASLLQRLYDPSSPDFRQFLSVDQFTERFGPTVHDYQAAVAFAQANGFTVTGTPVNRLVVPISGTVDQINSAFHVRMNIYRHPTEDRTFYSPDREPSLNLSVPVAHVAGLNNFHLPRPMVTEPQLGHEVANVSGSGPGGSYLASDMRAAYYGGTTLDGNGQAVGLLEFSGYDLSDVNSTFSNAGQTYNVAINNVLLDGATGAPGGGNGAPEVVLDIVQAIGMAPGLSQVRVYIGQGLDDANILNTMASENIAKQISSSWSWTPDDPKTDDVFFQEFAAQGQSFFTASGDYGAWDASISPFFYPAEDQYVTAVGGTHLTTNGPGGTWALETAWNSLGDGSGGGISPDNIAIPGWQSGVANSSNAGSATLRNVPDVSMEGDFDNYVCAEGSCSGGWAGTSFAAPRWAGFMALVNEQAVEAGTAPTGGVGFLNPALYTLAEGSTYIKDLHDITSGNNDTANQPLWFSAVTGYDLVTGWGSANGQNLIDDLAGAPVPGFWILGTPAAVSVNQGASSSTTINVTDAGGFSGNVTLAVTSPLPTGVTALWGTNPTSGSSVLTLTATSSAPSSTTAVTITGTSGNLRATTNITVAIHAPSFLLSASPGSLQMNQDGSATSTITVAPQYGFTGNVSLSLSGLPSGVSASFSPTSTTGASTLTLTASNTANVGASTLTITGTSGNLTATATLSVSIHGPSFTLSTPGLLNLGQGKSGTASFSVAPQYGFNGNVNFAVSGLPQGVTASVSPNPTMTMTTLTLTASSTASVGTSTLTIIGTSGSLTATTTLTLSLYAPAFTLSGPGSVNIGQGMSGTSYVTVVPQYGFAGNVTFALSGLPSGVTALWNPNPTTGTSLLTLTASSSAAPGNSTLTITGTSGNLKATTTVTLGIYAPSFTISNPGTVNVGQGTSLTTQVYVNPQYGFTGKVNFSVSGLPSGVTASFSPNPTTGFSTLTVTAGSTAPVGQYTLTITGTSGNLTATTALMVAVYTPTFTLSSYGLNVGQGTYGTAFVFVNSQYGFAGHVNLVVSGLPSGVTASFSPNPATAGSVLTVTAGSTAPVGQYTLTITGTSGTQTATTTITLGTYVPSFGLFSPGSVSLGQGSSSTTYVSVNPQYGFSGNVNLSVSGLPNGVTASFSQNPTSSNTVLTLTASSTAPPGQYPLTISGVSGTQTVTTPLTLGVYAPSFTIYPVGINIGQGASGTTNVWVSPQYGFNGSVNLSVSGLPSGVTASWSPNPATTNSILTLTTSSSVTLGQYNLTITGTSGTETVTAIMSLGIYAPGFNLSSSTGYLSMNEGSSATTTINVSPQWGFTGSVNLTASGLPSGVTASFSPNPSTGNSTLTLVASKTATPGNATVTIIGASGSLTAWTDIYLTVNAADFAISTAPGEINLAPGGSGKSTVAVVAQNGFDDNVSFAASGLPSGVTATFSPNPSGPGSSVLTLTASSSAPLGTKTLAIIGTSGSQTATTSLVLTIASAVSTTSTTLQVSSAGNPVTSVPSGTVVVLTAAVKGGSIPLTGQVNFCDATAKYCDPTHLVGSAQLTSAGTASIQFIPGMGNHSYKAVFAGTLANGGSSSVASSLTVTASQVSTTTMSESGNPGDYTLNATVTGQGPVAPGGTVSFLDTSNANSVLGSAALGNGVATLSWQNPQSPATGTQPGSIALGDFNGDGVLDMAVTNAGSNTLTILLGNGDGTFNAASSSPQTSTDPSFVTVGDFNRDGKADLAVANLGSNNVTILLGNGDGTFTAASSSPETGYQPQSMAVGDFNCDGILDLAVLNAEMNTVTVLLGNGDGTFTASPLSSQTGSQPRSLVTGDFNGDGILDLAVTNSEANTVTILLGNGEGSFAAAPSPATGTYPVAGAVGDFNLDGKLDLAVADEFSGSVTILLGNGDGTFTAAAASPPVGSNPVAISVADLNRDGKPDLVVANGTNGTVTILLGNGDGTFGPANSQSAGSNPISIAVGDLNGDGIQDLATANLYGNDVSVLTLQLTQVSTATATGISPAGTGTHNVEASYPGDTSYRSSVSGTTPLTAELITPTLTVTPSSSSITTTQALTVSVTVSGPSGNAAPTGSVMLTSGSYTSAAAILSKGTATINIPAGTLAAGTDTLTVSYTPDSSSSSTYLSATGSNSVTVTTTAKVTPTVSLTPSSSSITTAQALTVSVTVSGGSATPAGSVTLASGSYSSQQNLSAGTTTFNLAAGTLPVGKNTLSATYTPDVSAAGAYTTATQSASITVVQELGTIVPAITAKVSIATITDLESVQVTVSLSGVNGQATPTGSIALTGGAYNAQQTLSSGMATFTVAPGSLSSGANTLTAAYSGDATYATARATTVVTVAPFVMSVPPLSPVSPGSNATGSVKLTAGSTYSGTPNLTCSLMTSPAGAQSQPTCSLTPASMNLASGGSGSAVLTVGTTAASPASAQLNFWRIGGGPILAALIMFGVPSRRRRWASALMVLLVIVGGGVTGCGGGRGGGGGGSQQATQPSTPATTAGSYTFTVTATDAANAKLTASTNVIVTVE